MMNKMVDKNYYTKGAENCRCRKKCRQSMLLFWVVILFTRTFPQLLSSNTKGEGCKDVCKRYYVNYRMVIVMENLF